MNYEHVWTDYWFQISFCVKMCMSINSFPKKKKKGGITSKNLKYFHASEPLSSSLLQLAKNVWTCIELRHRAIFRQTDIVARGRFYPAAS